MADVINLRRARKRKARAAAAQQAAANRLQFGRTLAEKQAAARETEAAQQRLDGHHREPPAQD